MDKQDMRRRILNGEFANLLVDMNGGDYVITHDRWVSVLVSLFSSSLLDWYDFIHKMFCDIDVDDEYGIDFHTISRGLVLSSGGDYDEQAVSDFNEWIGWEAA